MAEIGLVVSFTVINVHCDVFGFFSGIFGKPHLNANKRQRRMETNVFFFMWRSRTHMERASIVLAMLSRRCCCCSR